MFQHSVVARSFNQSSAVLPQRAFTQRLAGRPYDPESVISETVDVTDSAPKRTVDTETCIRKVLGQACIRWIDPKTREDLEQHIRIELNQARKKYGEGMNEPLAWQIAHNQIVKFLDKNARKPQELSIDDKPEDPEDEDKDVSYAEFVVNATAREGVKSWSFGNGSEELRKGGDWLQGLEEHGGIPALERLVGTWHGTKRIVGEALLKDSDIGVCDLPGVPRSTFSRVRQAVLREFEQVLRTPVLTIISQKQLAGRVIQFLKDHGLTVEEAKALSAGQQQMLRDSFQVSENKEVTELVEN